MITTEQARSNPLEEKEDVFPVAAVSAVELPPELESIISRVKKGERTLRFLNRKRSLRRKIMHMVGRGSVFLTQGRFVDFKYTK